MPYLKSEQGYSSDSLATVLFVYSIAYSGGQFLMGYLADRFGPRRVVTAGMVASALCSAGTGLWTPLAALQGLNGLAQSCGWPGVLRMSRDWFPVENRGVVLAWWSTHMVVGGFVATNLAARAAEGGWMRGAWVPALLVAAIALVFGFFSRDKPVHPHTVSKPKGALKITPALTAIAVMYFCIKLTRYAFLFWLPLYMTEALRYTPTHAGYASSVFELVGFAGVLGAGYVSEHAQKGRRFPVAAVMMAALAVLCAAYPHVSGGGWWINVAFIAMIGAFTFGPDTLIAAAAVQDAVPPENTGAAGGFVNGVGSTGQILSPYVVSLLSVYFGWQTLFAVLGCAALIGAGALASQWRRG